MKFTMFRFFFCLEVKIVLLFTTYFSILNNDQIVKTVRCDSDQLVRDLSFICRPPREDGMPLQEAGARLNPLACYLSPG